MRSKNTDMVLRYDPLWLRFLKYFKKKVPVQDHRPGRIKEEEIACGGMSIIFRNTYANSNVEVEKILLSKYQGKTEFEEMHRREFSILKSLDHPLILRAIREFPIDINQFIRTNITTYEHIKGRSLAGFDSFLRHANNRDRRLFARSLAAQLLSALQYLQSKDVIHGDIAPDNILIQENGFIKLIDFGVSKKSSDPALRVQVVGRVYFKAPELKTNGKTSLAGDVYAVGRILEEVFGDDAELDEDTKILIHQLIENREFPDYIFGQKIGTIWPIQPLPQNWDWTAKGTIPVKTKVEEFIPWYRAYPLLNQALGLLFIFLICSSWMPQTAIITVNTIPYSWFSIQSIDSGIRYETPVRRLKIPAGPLKIDFVIPSQNNRQIKKILYAHPGDHVKVFEDFKILDTLKK